MAKTADGDAFSVKKGSRREVGRAMLNALKPSATEVVLTLNNIRDASATGQGDTERRNPLCSSIEICVPPCWCPSLASSKVVATVQFRA